MQACIEIALLLDSSNNREYLRCIKVLENLVVWQQQHLLIVIYGLHTCTVSIVLFLT